MKKLLKNFSSFGYIILLGVVVGLVLAGFGIKANFGEPRSAKAGTTLDTIITMASNSYQNWRELSGQAKIVWKRFDETQSYLIDFDFDLPDRASVITEDLNGGHNGGQWAFDQSGNVKLSDSSQIENSESIPPSLKQYFDEGQFFEQNIRDGAVVMHPMTMAIPSPIGEYLFPSWLSLKLNHENTELIGEENLSTRKVWVIKAVLDHEENYTLWVDQETGILLKVFRQINPDFSMELVFLKLSQFDKYKTEIWDF